MNKIFESIILQDLDYLASLYETAAEEELQKLNLPGRKHLPLEHFELIALINERS